MYIYIYMTPNEWCVFPAALRGMGSNFVLGYIQAMDGEKDPRNLVIAFSSVHRIVLHLPFGGH